MKKNGIFFDFDFAFRGWSGTDSNDCCMVTSSGEISIELHHRHLHTLFQSKDIKVTRELDIFKKWFLGQYLPVTPFVSNETCFTVCIIHNSTNEPNNVFHENHHTFSYSQNESRKWPLFPFFYIFMNFSRACFCRNTNSARSSPEVEIRIYPYSALMFLQHSPGFRPHCPLHPEIFDLHHFQIPIQIFCIIGWHKWVFVVCEATGSSFCRFMYVGIQ